MPEGPAFPAAFSDREMRRRRDALAAELAGRDLTHALVYGANRSGSAVSWLTGWPVTREALLVARPDPAGDLLLVGFPNHVPQARRLSRVPVESTGAVAVETALRHLPDGVGRVGVIGALPFDQYRRLAARVEEVVDLNAAHTALRTVKSAEEVEALRRAAALSDAATAALAGALRPGVTEHELAAAIEAAYVPLGGMHAIHYVCATSMDDPAVPVPAQWPGERRLTGRDVVSCEISVAVAPDYAGQVLRTFTVADPPTRLFRDLHEVATAAFEAVAARLVPGTHAADLLSAAAVIEKSGFSVVDDVVHGYGGGYLPPVLRIPDQQRGPVPDLVLAAGMTLVVQPNVTTPDGRAGVQTGELLLVTDEGPRRLHAFPKGFIAVH